MFRVAAYSNVGLRKKTNQDSCCAEVAVTPYGDTALLAVCDGVGGLSSGEYASATVVHWLVDWFETSYATVLGELHNDVESLFDRVRVEWDNGLFTLNQVLRTYGRRHDTKLGTTCTVMLLYAGHYCIAHVGDTRVYRFSQGEMDVLTDDQTWVAQELARGNITLEQARSHPKKNVILQSIGTQTELQPVYYRGETNVGETYVVCCDGFRNELFDDELIHAFGRSTNVSKQVIYDACADLAELVMARNEHDNITAVGLSITTDGAYDLSVSYETEAVLHADEEAYVPAEATTYLAEESTEASAPADATTAMSPIKVDDEKPAAEQDTSPEAVPDTGDEMTTVLEPSEDATTILDDMGGDVRG